MKHSDAPFRLLLPSLVLCLMATVHVHANVLLTEIMAANSATLADEDGAFSDWIEIHNPEATPIDLAGWMLTDSSGKKNKWQFPSVTLPPGGYLVVFASNKDRRDPAAPLHTDFALSADGEYLALIKPDGTTASEFAPQFPPQDDDISYGLAPNGNGGFGSAAYLSRPTPGAANAAASAGNLAETVSFSRPPGPFRTAFSLELSGAGPSQHIRYLAVPSNAGADAPEPVATSSEYTGPLVINASLVIRAAVFSADGTSHGPVATIYFARIGASVQGFSSQLPVMVIDSLGTGQLYKDGYDHPSWMYLYNAKGAAPSFGSAPEVVSPMTTSVRGSSSAEFAKKGYNIKFTDIQGKKHAQALLDLPAYEKWALVAPWCFDMGYINNAVVYSLSNELGRWAPRTRFVEVFFNSNGGDIDLADYAGIYVITDRIEVGEGRVDINSLARSDVNEPAVTGGYIVKVDHQEQDDLGWMTRKMPEFGDSSVILVAPKAEDIAPAQLSYIQNYFQQMEDALLADQRTGFGQRTYLDFIDRASWVDYHLLNTFACNPDAFTRSTYFTKPREGKLIAGPVWDYDRAMGSYWDERSYRWDVWSGVGGPDYWNLSWWGIIAQDPEFMQDWIDRWQSLRRSDLSNGSIEGLVNTLGGQIGSDAANRDSTRWPDSVPPTGSYAGQLTHLRNWMYNRAGWIDGQFLAAPSVAVSGGSLVIRAPAGAQLAYTLDGSDPRALGGGIAPNATLTASQLTVAANANVHVRSYRADLRGVFPGSPWSSAVGGELSSPLTPRSRLVNISSRAIVGTGENALIAGVVVADTLSKRYLSRAVGPGLAAFGAAGVVPDPQLSIFAGNGVELYRNNGWESGRDAARIPGYSKSVGAFPLGPGADSALADTIGSGAYTVQVTTPSDRSGVGLAELYELDGNGRTVNLSTRARVRTGDGVLIGGFVVQGPAYKRMLIRAVGPTLKAFGLADALEDPILTVYSGQQVVATNDRWQAAENASAVTTASGNAGAFALAANSEDAAMLITLPPGAYTVEVKGKDNREGVALLEIYEVP